MRLHLRLHLHVYLHLRLHLCFHFHLHLNLDCVGAPGCHFGRLGGHFGSMLEAKIMPKSVPKQHYFSIMDFVRLWCVSGFIFAFVLMFFGGCKVGSRNSLICKV